MVRLREGHVEAHDDLRTLEQRQADRDQLQLEQLDRENERRVALGLEPLESVEALEAIDTSDIQLDQAMRVVADMAALADGTATTAEAITTSATISR